MDNQVAEQITLDSGEIILRPDKNDLKKITLELSQASNTQKVQKLFRIFDNQVLGAGEKGPKQTKTFLVNLLLLDETPKRNWDFNRTCLHAAIGSGAGAILLYFLKALGLGFLSSGYIFAVIALLAAGAVYLLWEVAKNARSVLVFETIHGRIPIVELYYNTPDRSRFQGFIKKLRKTIATVKSTHHFNEAGFLPAELGEHRRLRDEGIISEKQYELAKSNILGKH